MQHILRRPTPPQFPIGDQQELPPFVVSSPPLELPRPNFPHSPPAGYAVRGDRVEESPRGGASPKPVCLASAIAACRSTNADSLLACLLKRYSGYEPSGVSEKQMYCVNIYCLGRGSLNSLYYSSQTNATAHHTSARLEVSVPRRRFAVVESSRPGLD